MCILFVYINNEAREGEYQLILANNRDELYDRPTQPAHFWKDHPHCIGGVDSEPGREGGTWLAMSKKGKIGVLLNILQPSGPDRTKTGRGHLVADFVGSDVTASELLQRVKHKIDLYNDFNLVLLERREGKWKTEYIGCGDKKSPSPIKSDIFGVSNANMTTPWKKVGHGLQIFQNVVGEFNAVEDRDELLTRLKHLMKDNKRNQPDEQLRSQCGTYTYMTPLLEEQRSSVFVHSPHVRYGTRTHSFVLVDHAGHAEYVEHTLKTPVDTENLEWDVRSFNFDLTR